MSGFVIKKYIGDGILQNTDHPFFRRKREQSDWEFSARLTQIAAALFELRNDPGFPEICRRLRERDLVSAHYELASAVKLKQQGFLIHAKPETGTKRRDFDFTATLRNCTLNREVTLLRPTTFSRRNVLNALGRKRKQLPDDAPAFIDRFWPVEHWRSQVPDMRAEFMSIAEEFFRGSRRVNYLAFSNEEFRHREGGGALLIEATTIAHANPRHRSHFLDIAMQSPPRRHQEIKEKLGSEEQHFGGFSEYDEWVDSLFED